MKAILFNLIFLISISFNTVAQDFAPVGAKWHFQESHAWSNNIGFITYDSVGDTLINDLPCRKIFKSDYSCCILGDYHFLHQTNDSVFLFNPATETFDLLFDFGADVGDSWTVRTKPDGYFISDSVICKVDSITFFHYSATDSLKVQHVTLTSPEYYIDLSGDTIYYSSNNSIIEKIGFRSSLLLRDCYSACDANFDGPVRCYEDSEVGLITFSSVACDYTPIENIEFKEEISIYPNPVTDKIMLETKDLRIDKATLISSEGSYFEIPIRNNEINVSSLSAGIYFLKFQTSKGIITKKIVVL